MAAFALVVVLVGVRTPYAPQLGHPSAPHNARLWLAGSLTRRLRKAGLRLVPQSDYFAQRCSSTCSSSSTERQRGPRVTHVDHRGSDDHSVHANHRGPSEAREETLANVDARRSDLLNDSRDMCICVLGLAWSEAKIKPPRPPQGVLVCVQSKIEEIDMRMYD